MDRSTVIAYLSASAVLALVVGWGWWSLDPAAAVVSHAAATRAWEAATVVAHAGFVGLLLLAARGRARGLSGWRGVVAHVAAWAWYAAATVLVWGLYGDAILHFKQATGLWQGEFSGAVFVMIVAWPVAAGITLGTWAVAGVVRARRGGGG